MNDRASRIDSLLGEVREVSRDEAEALAVKAAGLLKALELRAVRPVEPKPEPPKFLTLPEVAEKTRKSHRWWRENWRAELGAQASRKGRTVVVPEDAVDAWMRRS